MPTGFVKIFDYERNGIFRPYQGKFLQHPRVFSSVCLVGTDDIVVTGSHSTTESVEKKCEYYSPGEGWSPLPDFDEGRNKHSSCCINNKIVFIFGGVSNNVSDRSFDRLNLGDLERGWNKILLRVSDTFAVNANCLQISNREVLVFGDHTQIYFNRVTSKVRGRAFNNGISIEVNRRPAVLTK